MAGRYVFKKVDDNQLGLIVYIDGRLIGGAGIEGHENYDPITRKVWRKITKTFNPYRKIKMSKKFRKEHFEPKKIILYSPIFYTTKSFIRHYKKVDGLEHLNAVGVTTR